MKHLIVALVSVMLVSTTAYASPQAPTNGGNGGGASGVCTGAASDRPMSCASPLLLSPVMDAVDTAAKKAHVKIYLCHWSEEDQEFELIYVDSHGAEHHLTKHALDFVAQDGADTDCNAPLV